MNWRSLQAGWVRLRGRLGMSWGRLRDDRLRVIEGRRELLLGELQEAYGVTTDEAERQVAAWEAEIVEGEQRLSRAAQARRAL